MWNYEKRLQFPVNITRPNAKIAQIIISQYGGPDGEAAASFRYLSQRYSMPYNKVAGLLTDIGTEELAHLEMIAAIVRQLTKGLSAEELEAAGFAPYYVDHRRQPAVFRLMPVNSRAKAMRSRIFLKIWLRSRKPAPPTIIFYVLSKIRKSVNRSVFCASAKSCISSVSVKASAWFKKNLTAKTFICATRNLIWDVANRLHVLQAGLLSQTTFCILLA